MAEFSVNNFTLCSRSEGCMKVGPRLVVITNRASH